jgi:peptidoglycan/xylan/chitin deacetylase (PgdA/CDA1 family)
VHAFDTKEKHASDQLRALLKRVPEHTKKRILAEMDGNLPVLGDASMRDDYRPCSWSQLRQLADGGITIGAHTITHPILSRVESVDEIKREIVASKAELEDKLQHPVASFAYPNGMQEDINQVSVDCARAHFKAAVTAIPGLNAPGTDVYELLRLPCDPDVPVPQMARSLAGPIRRRAEQAALNSSH